MVGCDAMQCSALVGDGFPPRFNNSVIYDLIAFRLNGIGFTNNGHLS